LLLLRLKVDRTLGHSCCRHTLEHLLLLLHLLLRRDPTLLLLLLLHMGPRWQ
jgi:hypothetical protein